jgi:glycosyltransferase involved in cell wall biosynthesis
MAPGPPLFSVVVPSRGEESKLLALLESLGAQTLERGRYELILVLDGLTPIASVSAAAQASGARIVALESRRGPGAARNQGAARARGEYLAFTEDDCRPAADWLGRAAAWLAEEPALDVLEGFTRLPDGKPARRQFGQAPLYLPTNLFVRRAVFEKVGGYCEAFYDPASGVYFREDSDLGFTLEESGARVAIAQDVVVTHPFEHPRFLDPIRWARRYQMDPLLQSRHPKLFRERIEVHRVGPFTVRRPFVWASAGYLLALALSVIAGALRLPQVQVASLVVAAALLVTIWTKWRIHPLRLAAAAIVPFFLLASLIWGTQAVRRERRAA